MGPEPGSYQVTARQAAFAQDHLDIEPTDHFEGNKPVRLRVRPEPRWLGTLSQSGLPPMVAALPRRLKAF